MTPQALRRIERTNYLLGAILIALVAVVGTSEQTLGAAVGALLSAFNFTAVRGIVERVAGSADGGAARPALIFLPKMAVLMAAVALAIFYLPLSPVMLAVGFSIFLLSIAIETVRFVSGQRGDAPGVGDNSHG
jgi:hypothetical protein